jgi:UDP-N-acetylmuramate--alanine ligase
VVAVAGGAGKTSTSAILATVLISAARQPTVYLGARSPNLGGRNYLPGSRDLLIAEADEYMHAFLALPRSIGILGPVMDYDHRDYFRSAHDVSDAFTAFAAGLELAIADGDSPAALRAARAAQQVISVGCSPGSDWRIADVDPQRGSWRLTGPGGHSTLTLSTVHRGPALWMNASRAAVAALELGVPATAVEQGIRAYQGVSRRMELRHSAPGMLMLDDYAHNPAQIQALAQALRGYYPQRRIIAVFEPRQHRRTALYCDQFGQALAGFGACLLLPISPGLGDQEYGRIARLGAVRDAITRHGGPPARICDSYDHAAAVLADVVRYGDVVVSLGTGSPYLALDTLASMIERAS